MLQSYNLIPTLPKINAKKMPRHHDAASSKYQNNVSNTNYYN